VTPHEFALYDSMMRGTDDLPDVLDLLDLLTPNEAAWRKQAACRGADPTLFMPSRGDDVRPAKAICAVCPVKDDCLEQALTGHESGIWGGTSQVERKRLISQRQPTETRRDHGTVACYRSGETNEDNSCRCGPCRKANAQQSARTRERRREAA